LRVELADDTAMGIRRNRLRIARNEMTTEIFEPVISDVLGLVREQIVMAGNSTVAAVLLVGGFGSSQYLKDRITTAVGPINVLQPANGWTAVVQGAAMIGLSRANVALGRVNISARTARKHYGTELTTAFDPARDDPTKKSVHFGAFGNHADCLIGFGMPNGTSTRLPECFGLSLR